MVPRRLLVAQILLFFIAGNLISQHTDPYHNSTGGFGYLIEHNQDLAIWWCEGAYKIMLDTPLPERRSESIELWSARNEYEPFQLVFDPEVSIEGVTVEVDNLAGPYGQISSENIEIRVVEYVNVTKPTDNYGYKGLWPDPLPLVDDTFGMPAGKNTTLWVTIYIPDTAMPGVYTTTLNLYGTEWSKEIPVNITVWDFSLPKEASIRSGFGLSVDKIADYHNITESDDLIETFDLYMKSFRDYKISPYSFYYLHPIKKRTTGIPWNGGYFDSQVKFDGKYSLRVEDNSETEAIYCSLNGEIEIDCNKRYMLSWIAKSATNNQQFCVVIESYDINGELLLFENKVELFTADTIWKKKSYKPGVFGDNVCMIKLSFYPAFRSAEGEHTGTVWFDNIELTNDDDNTNLITCGDLEVDPDSIDIRLDFTDFDFAATRYLDEFGFNGFRLNLEGMGSGTYYSRTEGVFEGFAQGTGEYEKLMGLYLSQIEEHFREKGWLGKEYVYWFDEPGRQDYPFVRDGMELIKNSAPGITTFLTENDPGPEIMDVTDITCTIWHRINPEKARSIHDNGQQYWSYLCTAPKSPWVSEFIDHDAINLRIWLWMSYSYKLNGILIWSSNYWNSRAASPVGYMQNPWEQPASFVQGYGWPLGKQTVWGNGDGRFWYPPNRNPNSDRRKYVVGPVPSIRLEFLRQGIEDYEYLVKLESLIENSSQISQGLKRRAQKLLSIPGTIFRDGKTYTKNPADLLNHRKKLADMIIDMQNQTK